MISLTTLRTRTAEWNRPMLYSACAHAVMIVVTGVAMAVDDRVVLGDPAWLKPFKFAVSVTLYSFAWSWLTSLLDRGRRTAAVASAIVAVAFAVEYIALSVQAARGTPSHFNVGAPFDRAVWSAMTYAIAALWLASIVLVVLVQRSSLADRPMRWAIRIGVLVSFGGISLGILMTSPTDAQRAQLAANGRSAMIGGHAVGVPDGGPGLPVTGWSTVGGDLRIGHFVGMHALQLLPFLAVGLMWLARRFPLLRNESLRTRLVFIAGLGYAALTALVVWQALRGQPLSRPDGATTAAFACLLLVVSISVALAVRGTPRPAPPTPEPSAAESTRTGRR